MPVITCDLLRPWISMMRVEVCYNALSYLFFPVYILISFLALFVGSVCECARVCVKPSPIQLLCSFLFLLLLLFPFHWALLGVLYLPMSPYFSSLFLSFVFWLQGNGFFLLLELNRLFALFYDSQAVRIYMKAEDHHSAAAFSKR